MNQPRPCCRRSRGRSGPDHRADARHCRPPTGESGRRGGGAILASISTPFDIFIVDETAPVGCQAQHQLAARPTDTSTTRAGWSMGPRLWWIWI